MKTRTARLYTSLYIHRANFIQTHNAALQKGKGTRSREQMAPFVTRTLRLNPRYMCIYMYIYIYIICICVSRSGGNLGVILAKYLCLFSQLVCWQCCWLCYLHRVLPHLPGVPRYRRLPLRPRCQRERVSSRAARCMQGIFRKLRLCLLYTCIHTYAYIHTHVHTCTDLND